MEYKKGDVVYLFKKPVSWEHGRYEEKTDAFLGRDRLTITNNVFHCDHGDCFETKSDHCDLMTLPADCLKLYRKKPSIII